MSGEPRQKESSLRQMARCTLIEAGVAARRQQDSLEEATLRHYTRSPRHLQGCYHTQNQHIIAHDLQGTRT